jgi:hypothetical protein
MVSYCPPGEYRADHLNIHLRKSRNIQVENIKIFSGKDGLDNVLDFDAELRRIRLYMQAPWRDGEALFFLSNSEAYVKLEDVIVY